MIIKAWIPNYEGWYEIDTTGTITSYVGQTPKVIKPTKVVYKSPTKKPYMLITLFNPEKKTHKQFHLARLVYETFAVIKLEKADKLIFLDCDFTNVNFKNLKLEEKPLKKLRPKYKVIDNNIEKDYFSASQIQREYGISRTQFEKALKNDGWITIYNMKNL